MRLVIAAAALVAGHLMLGGAPAVAAPLTWELHDVRFADGGTVKGSFAFDAGLGLIGTYVLHVRGGNTALFPEIDFTPGVAELLPGHENRAFTFALPATGGRRDLRLVFEDALTDAPATRPLVLIGDLSIECFNCSPFRALVAGSAVAESPTIAMPGLHSGLLLAGGAGLLAGLVACAAGRRSTRERRP